MVGESGGPLPWFPVRHETPDAFMEPEWIVHPNGALAMMAIHAVAEDPREVAKALEAAWTAKIEEILEGCMMVKAGSVELLIWSPAAYQNEYKALEVMAPQSLPSVRTVGFWTCLPNSMLTAPTSVHIRRCARCTA